MTRQFFKANVQTLRVQCTDHALRSKSVIYYRSFILKRNARFRISIQTLKIFNQSEMAWIEGNGIFHTSAALTYSGSDGQVQANSCTLGPNKYHPKIFLFILHFCFNGFPWDVPLQYGFTNSCCPRLYCWSDSNFSGIPFYCISIFAVKIISDQMPFGGFRALAAFPSVCSEFFLFLGSPGGGSSPLEVNVDGEKTRVSTL